MGQAGVVLTPPRYMMPRRQPHPVERKCRGLVSRPDHRPVPGKGQARHLAERLFLLQRLRDPRYSALAVVQDDGIDVAGDERSGVCRCGVAADHDRG